MKQAERSVAQSKPAAQFAFEIADVHVVRYEDALNITASEPLVDYILSMATAVPLRERRAELQHFIEDELAAHGVIHITKESGMFIGRKAR